MFIDNLFVEQEHRQLQDLRRLILDGEPIVVFGAGNLGKKVISFLRRNGFNINAISDNNPSRWGCEIEGSQIVNPNTFSDYILKKAIWIVSIWSPGHSYTQIKKQINALGVVNVFHAAALMQLYPNDLLPHYHFQTPGYFLRHKEEITEVCECFADEESKQQYYAHVDCRINLNFEGLPISDTANQYFPADVVFLSNNEVFFDAGAYDGDTLKDFTKRVSYNFKRYLALEPDPVNYKKLSAVAETLPSKKVEVFPFAVGSENTVLKFDATGSAGAGVSKTGTIEVECIRVDDFFFDYKPTYLKFDIEGAELDALKGAEKTIEDSRPNLAVCIYHQPDDLWKIPLYLKRRFPFYKLYARTHQHDGLDFVLYAISK